MEMFVIHPRGPLQGRVRVSGAKNSALPLMAVCLAMDGPCLLRGIPELVDVRTLSEVLKALGMRVERNAAGDLELETLDLQPHVADYELVRRMRASICVLGPLLGRRGRACVSLPGGCNIGYRPIDLHLQGLAALGAEIRVERGYIIAEAKRLKGADLNLAGPRGSSVTGTCNVMTAACFAEGTTRIHAAALEPEVVDLGHFLIQRGAIIAGLGTNCVTIEGVGGLTGGEGTVIPDRIEAATLMVAAAITGGRVELEQVIPEHLQAVIDVLREIGVSVEIERAEAGDCELRHGNGEWGSGGVGESLHSLATRPWPPFEPKTVIVETRGPLRATEFIARPFPGIPTDVQAQLTALLVSVPGNSVVTDNVFPDRFMHLAELTRMGACLRQEGNTAQITGVERLTGASVMASDLRASAALVLAALAANGPSVVRRIYHLDRGYEGLERKLVSLGADVRRVPDQPAYVPSELRDSPELFSDRRTDPQVRPERS